MDAYLTFKNVEKEINDVQREVVKQHDSKLSTSINTLQTQKNLMNLNAILRGINVPGENSFSNRKKRIIM